MVVVFCIFAIDRRRKFTVITIGAGSQMLVRWTMVLFIPWYLKAFTFSLLFLTWWTFDICLWPFLGKPTSRWRYWIDERPSAFVTQPKYVLSWEVVEIYIYHKSTILDLIRTFNNISYVELFVEGLVFELLISIESFILSDVLLLLAIDSFSKLTLFSLLHIFIGVTGFNLSKVTDLGSVSIVVTSPFFLTGVLV